MAKVQYFGTGRRKVSVARVRLLPGDGKFTINGRDIDDYFGLETLKMIARQPLALTNTTDSFDVVVNVYGGGFNGHPSDENYARWIEFGAFTPIFRVHGTFNEKRQPWRYGPIAETAATKAIRLRYKLIPYIYAYQRAGYAHGVGLVRPLTFAWPDDPKVRDDVDAWLFGQWLLVSPVVASEHADESG